MDFKIRADSKLRIWVGRWPTGKQHYFLCASDDIPCFSGEGLERVEGVNRISKGIARLLVGKLRPGQAIQLRTGMGRPVNMNNLGPA